MKGKTSISHQSDQTSRSVHGRNSGPFFSQKTKMHTVNTRRHFFTPAIQPKLTVNAPNDIYEKEADAVADQVMRMPHPQVQRQSGEEEEIMTKKQEPAIRERARGVKQRSCSGSPRPKKRRRY